MALVVAIEPLRVETCIDIDAYLVGQYTATPAHTDLPAYDHDWTAYMSMQAQDMTVFVTAREDGKLVGYAMYVITPMLHHCKYLMAVCDALVTWYTHRGQGIGRLLYEVAEKECIDRGANRIVNHHRLCYGAEPIFPKLGFKLIEHVYMKEV